MARYLDAVVRLFDRPIRADHERRPLHLQSDAVPFARFLGNRTVLRREGQVLVDQQREPELVLQRESAVRLGSLGAYPEDDNALGIEL